MPFNYKVTLSNTQNRILTDALAVDNPGKTVPQYIAECVGSKIQETSRRFPPPHILQKLEQVKALHQELNTPELVEVTSI